MRGPDEGDLMAGIVVFVGPILVAVLAVSAIFYAIGVGAP